MLTSKIILGIIGLSVGVFGTVVSAPVVAAPVVNETAIVTVSGSAGILADN